MFSGILGNIQGSFFTSVVHNLRLPALGLLGSLAVIDLVLTTLKHLGDPDTFKKLCFSLLKYLMVFYLLSGTNFQDLTGKFFQGCIYVGGIGSVPTGDVNIVNQIPDNIFKQGLSAGAEVLKQGGKLNIEFNAFIPAMIVEAAAKIATYPLNMIMAFIKSILVIICFGLLAIEVFVTIAEYYICAGVALIFIPFAVSRHTSFLAQKVLNALIGFGIKVIFVVLVANIGVKSIAGMDYRDTYGSIFTVLGIFILTLKVPKIAMDFMNGSPSQGGMAMVKTAVSTAIRAAGGMYQAARIGTTAAGAGGASGVTGATGATGAAGKMASGGGSKAATGSASEGGDLVNGSSLADNSEASETNAPSGGNGSASIAAPRSRLAGADRGIANHTKTSTSFGAGRRDARDKLDWQADNTGASMKSRLAGDGRTAGSGGGIGERMEVTREVAATDEMNKMAAKSYNNDNYFNNDIGKLDDNDEPDNKDKSLKKDKFTKDRLKKK